VSPLRWRLTLEYDGTAFVGWGIQPNGRSVQEVVERAAERLVGHPVRALVSGRTDAGVHALGQVATFDTTTPRSAESIRDGLNAYLPADVACVAADRVALDFDARRSARLKHYRYTWLDRPSRAPLSRHRVWHVRTRLDAERMHEAVQHLAGTHDYSAFRATGCNAPSPVRTLESWRVARDGDLVALDARGRGFLRHMIRIVAGSLNDVGRGHREPGWIGDVLEGRDRTRAGRTAPPRGLTLVSVTYAEPPG
jgi:tRNA pseudouridine38-40 synthase